jgi:hypothetical protein
MPSSAVDCHIKITRTFFNDNASVFKKVRALAAIPAFYGRWYPRLWFPSVAPSRYEEFGALGRHLRFVDRNARRMARTLFHCMLRHGLALEHRQALLGRFVDIAGELLAISAVCVRAKAMQSDDLERH